MPKNSSPTGGSATITLEYGQGEVDVGGPLVQDAAKVITSVEGRVACNEAAFGHRRLFEVVNGIDPDEAHAHITSYRNIIRTNTWPNVMQPDVGPSNFINRFGVAAMAYVDTAFLALDWLDGRDDAGLREVHHAVLVSESLRGQLGKSSPDGLDERLERALDELVDYLDDEDDLNILGALPPSLKPAETALVGDYYGMKAEFFFMPDFATLHELPAGSATWKFVRRYCRWRFDHFADLWEKLALLPVLDGDLVATDVGKVRTELLRTLPEPAQELADYVSALNALNLVLEPTLSFKGGPGLAHAEVFRSAAHLAPSPMERQLVLDRDHLLQHFQPNHTLKEN